MKILVTGYRGFIGRHLDFGRSYDQVGFDIRDGFEYDITNPYSVETFWDEQKPDVVIHLAANPKPYISEKYPWWDAQLNITGLLNVLQASLRNGVKFFVFPSTCQVYHVAGLPMHEESPVNPKSAYAISKYTGELYCKNYMERGLKTCILRFFNVYGPGQAEGYVIPDLIKKIMTGDDVVVSGSPDDSRDFVYVGDVTGAIKRVVESMDCVWGQTFNIASGLETRIGELCETIARALGREAKFTYGERPAGRFPGRYRAVISKAEHLLDWSPKITLEDGIKLTVLGDGL